MKHVIIISICFVAPCACNSLPESGSSNSSAASIDEVILLDTSFFGGRDLWISADGRAVYRFVSWPESGQGGLQEVRYSFTLSQEDLETLTELIDKHHFFRIKIKDRPPIPDEARPAICVQTENKVRVVCKWANDAQVDFDAIYLYLLDISASGAKGTEISRGAYDWAWEPDGFTENELIEQYRYSKVGTDGEKRLTR